MSLNRSFTRYSTPVRLTAAAFLLGAVTCRTFADVVTDWNAIRGIGPGVANFGVSGALVDPKITVYDEAGRLVMENDNWSSTGAIDMAALSEAATKSGAFPLATGSKGSALLVTL